MLVVNRGLVALDLSANIIGPRGADELAAALRVRPPGSPPPPTLPAPSPLIKWHTALLLVGLLNPPPPCARLCLAVALGNELPCHKM